jgi:DNA-binding NarL/FixJ family response regulator
MISIFIVDDQTIIRHGLKSLLEIQADLTVVGDAANGQEALEAIASLQQSQLPDVILLDVRMPVMDGVATTTELKKHYPEIKILILTTFDDDEYISQAMNYGANNREIAQKLYISEKTVKNHVTSILSKLNLRDRTQATLLFNQIELIDFSEK